MQNETNSARNDDYAAYTIADLGAIHQSSFNPRKHFDEAGLQELADSLQEHGLLEPIIVRPRDAGGYEIIAGERRWRAARIANFVKLPVRILENISDEKALELALIENLVRRDINPIEEAEGYAALAAMGYTQSDIAQKVNRSQPAVANAIRILQLPEDVQQMVASGEISVSHGKALLQYQDKPAIFERMVEESVVGTPVKEIERMSLRMAFSLSSTGVVKRIFSGDKFPQCTGCNDLKNIDGSVFCFNPECYTEQSKAAEAAELAKIEARLGKSVKMLNTKDMKHGTYQELRGTGPVGCDPECEFRRPCIDYSRKIVVCIKPGCYNKLANADNRQKSQDRKSKTEELTAPLWAMLDAREGMDKALVLVCRRSILTAPIDAVRTAIKRSGIAFDIDIVKDFGHEKTHLAFKELLELPGDQLIALAAEIELQQEASALRSNEHSTPVKIAWMLGMDPTAGWFECPVCHKRFTETHYGKREIDGVDYCSDTCGRKREVKSATVDESDSPCAREVSEIE